MAAFSNSAGPNYRKRSEIPVTRAAVLLVVGRAASRRWHARVKPPILALLSIVCSSRNLELLLSHQKGILADALLLFGGSYAKARKGRTSGNSVRKYDR